MHEATIEETNFSKFWTDSKIKALNFWETSKSERINYLSHLTGAILSLIGLILLLVESVPKDNNMKTIGFAVYGISLFLMYTSSTIYHGTQDPIKKKVLQIFDHCSIYLLIAGTYTPIMLTTLRYEKGPMILTLVWTIAVLGIGFKIIWKDKYDLLSTLGYLAAGWLIVLDISALYNLFPWEGFLWIFAGGVLYSIGAIFYLFEKLPANHEIWHFFVLSASICHFIAVYQHLT